MSQTNWLPGILVLGAGLVVAIAFLFASRRRSKLGISDHGDRLADLDRQAQLLIEQLKELSADRHHLDDQQFAAEKNRLELQAAAALRIRDEYLHRLRRGPAQAMASAPAAGEKTAAKPVGWLGRHQQLKGALWGGGVVLFFVVLGLLLSQERKPRPEGAVATGRTPPMQAAPDSKGPQDPELKEAIANAEAHPDSVEALARLSHELINRQQWEEASRITERALGLDPFHTESRIHRAVLKASRGDFDGAAKALDHLASTYPDAHEALLFLGALAIQAGDQRRALENFERYAAEAPANEQPPRFKEGITLLRKRLGLSTD